MRQRRIVVLSNTKAVVDRVRLAAGECEVREVSCLVQLADNDPMSTLVVDPGPVQRCCFERLAEWARRRPLRRIIYLCLPASPAVLLALPQVHPGMVADFSDFEALLAGNASDTSAARLAWNDLGRLLNRTIEDDEQRRFLSVARVRHPGDVTLGGVAEALGVGARHLASLVRHWFGLPPHVILGLFRVECLATDLRSTGMRLSDLAPMHGYASRQAMSRHFQAYTGITPAAYRLAGRGPVVDRGVERAVPVRDTQGERRAL